MTVVLSTTICKLSVVEINNRRRLRSGSYSIFFPVSYLDSSAEDSFHGPSGASDIDATIPKSNFTTKPPTTASATTTTTPLTSALTKKYDRQLREAETAMKTWKNEMRKMKEEIDSRPSRKDMEEGEEVNQWGYEEAACK